MTYVHCIEPATYVIQIFKCTHKNPSASAYELCIERYELSMLTLFDVRDVTYLSYLDTPLIRVSISNSVAAV